MDPRYDVEAFFQVALLRTFNGQIMRCDRVDRLFLHILLFLLRLFVGHAMHLTQISEENRTNFQGGFKSEVQHLPTE